MSDIKRAEDRLLNQAYRDIGGDAHKPVDLQKSGVELGLSANQMLLLLSSLVEDGYLLPMEQPGGLALYLTDKAIKEVVALKTRL